MTSDHNKAKISVDAARWMDEMAARENERSISQPPHTHVYRSDTFETEGHKVPAPEDVYDMVEKTGELKFSVEKFSIWAEDMSGERFVSCDQGTTHYIYKDGVYADGVAGWLKVAMNRCNRNRKVSIHYTREVLNQLGANTMITAGVIEAQDHSLTVLNNCILNTKTGEISQHTPDHITFSKLACDYVKGATCPEWMEFLNYALPADEIETLQEVFGYTLVRGYPYHTMFNLLGAGGNGKGVSMKILREMLGMASCSAVALQDVGERFFATDLYGKFAQISGDTSPKALTDTSMQKMLTGEDDVRIERKGKDAFDFVNHAKVISLMNELMKTEDQSDGFFRRFVLIRFDRTPDTARIHEKTGFERRIIDNEMPGVLNWALDGLARLRKRGGFRMTVEMTNDERRQLWNIEADHVQGFVKACCDIGVGTKRYIATQTFMSAYRRWHEDVYGIPPKESQGDITKAAPWAGFQKPSMARVRSDDMGMWLQDDGRERTHISVYKGICLKNTSGLSDVDEMYLADHWNEIFGNMPRGATCGAGRDDEVVPDVSAGSEIMRQIGIKMCSYGGAETEHKFTSISKGLEESGYNNDLISECVTRYKQGHRIYGMGDYKKGGVTIDAIA